MRSFPILVSALLALSVASAANAQPDKRAEADRLVAEAKATGDHGDLKGARELLFRAYKLDSYSETAGNLGRVEMRLGAWRDAAEHLSESLADLRENSHDAAKIGKATAWLAQAQAKVLTVRLRVKPVGATIAAPGQSSKAVGESGELEIFVEPGTTPISSAANGYEGRQDTVVGGAGEIKELQITLEPQAATASAPAAAPPPPVIDAPIAPDRELVFPKSDPPAAAWPWWPYAVGGGVTVVGLVGGIVFTSAAHSSESDYNGISLATANSTCGTGTTHGQDCARLSEAADKVAQRRDLATVGFVTAGAGAAATLGYFIWTQVDQPKHTSIRASAAVLPGRAYAVVTCSF